MSPRWSIDPATGSLSAVSGSPFAAGAGALSIAIDPAGTFAYVANETAASISEYSINAIDRRPDPGFRLAAGHRSRRESLAVDPAGRFVYAANVTAKNQVAAYSMTPSTRRPDSVGFAGSRRHLPCQRCARSVRPIRLCGQR